VCWRWRQQSWRGDLKSLQEVCAAVGQDCFVSVTFHFLGCLISASGQHWVTVKATMLLTSEAVFLRDSWQTISSPKVLMILKSQGFNPIHMHVNKWTCCIHSNRLTSVVPLLFLVVALSMPCSKRLPCEYSWVESKHGVSQTTEGLHMGLLPGGRNFTGVGARETKRSRPRPLTRQVISALFQWRQKAPKHSQHNSPSSQRGNTTSLATLLWSSTSPGCRYWDRVTVSFRQGKQLKGQTRNWIAQGNLQCGMYFSGFHNT
jgi:hypothetical protein